MTSAQRNRQTFEQSLHGLGEVAKEMEAIGNLCCFRGTFACTLGVGAGTISTDDFYTWVSLQPFLQCSRFSIWQKINRLVALQIHQDGSVALALAPRPVIHPKCS